MKLKVEDWEFERKCKIEGSKFKLVNFTFHDLQFSNKVLKKMFNEQKSSLYRGARLLTEHRHVIYILFLLIYLSFTIIWHKNPYKTI